VSALRLYVVWYVPSGDGRRVRVVPGFVVASSAEHAQAVSRKRFGASRIVRMRELTEKAA
jgi:hypothetical protein